MLSDLDLSNEAAALHELLPQFEADSADEDDTQHCPPFTNDLKLMVAKFESTADRPYQLNGPHDICKPHKCPVSRR